MEFASICKENFGYLCFFRRGVWFLNFLKENMFWLERYLFLRRARFTGALRAQR